MSGETLGGFANSNGSVARSARKAFERYPTAFNLFSDKPLLWHVDELPEADDIALVDGEVFRCVRVGQITIAEGRHGATLGVLVLRLLKTKAGKTALLEAAKL